VEWEYGAAMSSLKAPVRVLANPSPCDKCGKKMKLIYALQVCGLGAKVYKELILRSF
jgi:hypothetical protein